MSSADSRRTEGWDLRNALTNGLTLGVTQALSLGFSVLTSWLTARALGRGGYGSVAAVLTASQLLTTVGVHWSVASLIRFGSEEFVRTARLASTFWTRLVILALNLLVLFGLAPLWLPSLTGWLDIPADLHRLVLIHAAVMALWIHAQQSLLAAKLPGAYGSLMALERFAGGLLVASVLATLGLSSWLALAALIVAALLALGLAGRQLAPLILPPARPDWSRARQILGFSLPLIPAALSGYVASNHLDAFFIIAFLSVQDLGVYWVAYQYYGALLQLPLLAGSLLGPMLVTREVYQAGRSERRFLEELVPAATLTWSVLCGVLAAAGAWLLPLALGPDYQATSDLLWPLMAAAALAGPSLMGFLPLCTARSLTGISAWSSTITAAANVLFNFLLIPSVGLMGCAWATVIACGAGFGVSCVLVARRLRVRTWPVAQATLPALAGAAVSRMDSRAGLVLVLLLALVLGLHGRRNLVEVVRTLPSGRGR